jgi:hypothetical protein
MELQTTFPEPSVWSAWLDELQFVRPLIYREAPAVISPEVNRLPEVPLILPTPKPPVKYVLPEMARACEGEDVPMPTLPPVMPRRTPPEKVEVPVVDVALNIGAPIRLASMPREKVVVPVVVKAFKPEKRFESARRVEEAAVTVPDPPNAIAVPLTVTWFEVRPKTPLVSESPVPVNDEMT